MIRTIQKSIVAAAAATTLALACGAAVANDYTPGKWTAYGSVGTQGAGLGFGRAFGTQFGLRAEFNALPSLSRDVTAGNLSYDADLKVRSLSVLADWHPAGNAFRMTIGVVGSDSELTGRAYANQAGSVTINGTTYSVGAGEYLDGRVRMGGVSPYLGIGFGRVAGLKAGWGVFGDLGAFYAAPKATINVTGGVLSALEAAGQTGQIDEQRRLLQEQADKLRWYPVVRLGVRYTFN